jgi:hypothetical protein
MRLSAEARGASARNPALAAGRKGDQVLGQQVRLLEGGEVTAVGHHGEALDREEALGEFPWGTPACTSKVGEVRLGPISTASNGLVGPVPKASPQNSLAAST